MTEHETPSTGQAMSVVEVTSFETEAGYVGSDDGHEAGDAEMEELLIDDELEPLEHLADPPRSESVTPSNESAANLLANSTGELTPDFQPSDMLVTIPLSRLRQYAIDFVAQVIRDSTHLSISGPDPDLEHNSPEAERVGALTVQAITPRNLAPDPIFRNELIFSINHLAEPRRRMIKDIWDSVIPWEIFMLELELNEKLDPTDLVERCRNKLELYRIFISSDEIISNKNTSRAVLDASVLAWDVNECRQGSTDIMFGVLICCCLAAGRGNITIGNILKHCYNIGVLNRPAGTQLKDYLEHNLLVIECAFAMNRVVDLEPLFTYTDGEWNSELYGQNRVLKLLATKETQGEVLGLDLVELFQVLHMMNHEKPPLESASGNSFRVDDLNVKALRSIGRLHIEWTAIVENHLLLNLDKMTLSIMWSALPRESSTVGGWQSMFLNRLPLTFLDGNYCNKGGNFGTLKEKSLNEELERTWAFLYATSQNEMRRISFYNRLPLPPWVEDGVPEWMKEQQMEKPQPGIKRPRDHILMASFRKDLVPYSQFPIFETRLRQLRNYMDNQKPRGLRQLWIDKRDSANYYTFWGVITIGVLTIFLALVSLAVSIIQAWASVRALDLATPPAPPT